MELAISISASSLQSSSNRSSPLPRFSKGWSTSRVVSSRFRRRKSFDSCTIPWKRLGFKRPLLSKMPCKVLNFCSQAVAVLGPTPFSPGMLSELSPMSAKYSAICPAGRQTFLLHLWRPVCASRSLVGLWAEEVAERLRDPQSVLNLYLS